MADVQRKSDIVEERVTRLALAGVPGLIAVAIGAWLAFGGGMFVALGWILFLGGIAALLYGLIGLAALKRGAGFDLRCPFCHKTTSLTGVPERDVRCAHCDRMVPFENGRVLDISPVTCNSCHTTNYYTPHTKHLTCESCGKEIVFTVATSSDAPVATAESASGFHRVVLTGFGAHLDDLENYLMEHMRVTKPQVEELLLALPAVVFHGVSLEQAQAHVAAIVEHGGSADVVASA